MKRITVALTAIMLAVTCPAQVTKPSFVRGTMDIKYNTRNHADGNPVAGDIDVYTLNLNVCDSAVFRGKIEYTPIIVGMFSRVSQDASMAFDMQCDVVNPNNPQQTKNVGIVTGRVPIDANGTYRFGDGSVKVSVYQIGRASAFDSRFAGLAQGKPLLKQESLLSRVRKTAMEFTKTVNGKTLKVTVDKYDLMQFRGLKLPAGPVLSYPDATVDGMLVYDYEKGIWYFKDVTITYSVEGKQMGDRLSGSIRWVEQPKQNGVRDGAYQFDVRVNEAPPSEATAFAAPSDESAFFQTDDSVAALAGTMQYKDRFSGESVVQSDVLVDLAGNKLNRQQCMNLTKLLMFVCAVPFNAE